MRIIIYIIYEFTKFVAKTAIQVFYHPIVVIDKEKHDVDNAALMVSNHPNTLVDPFNGGVWIKRQIFFLANSNMFASYMGNLFFSNVHCIPVQRKTDKFAIDNTNSFKAVNEFLSKKGLLWIAMEGGSEMSRRLRPLKSGTARMAFDAEITNDWKLDLLILPVGLTYDASDYFRSRTTIVYGNPIKVSDYREHYERERNAAFRLLTADIRSRMLTLIIHTENQQQDLLLERIETLYQNENPLLGEAVFYRSQGIIHELQQMQKTNSPRYTVIENAVNQYFSQLQQQEIFDQAILHHIQRESNWYTLILLIIGFPVFLYGLVNSIIPALIPILALRKLKVDPSYNATVKIVVGIITFPLFWILQTVLVYHLFNSFWIALIYLLTLYPMGILAWEYSLIAKKLIRNLKFKHLESNQQLEIIEKRKMVWQSIKDLI